MASTSGVATWNVILDSLGFSPHHRGLGCSMTVPLRASIDVTMNGPLDEIARVRKPRLNSLGDFETLAARCG